MVIVMKCFIVPLKILLLTNGALKINSSIIHFYIFLYSFISFEKRTINKEFMNSLLI